MVDVSILMHDAAFATHYTVHRRKGEWNKGRFEITSEEALKYYGPVQPATETELNQLPEGDMRTGMMKFFCKPPKRLYITMDDLSKSLVSDTIEYDGIMYKIVQVKNWFHNGYIRAFAYPTEVIADV
jgi:hypothetical protein